MSRTDPDLIAVRELPPGVAEPSDEAVARVWHKIAARPAPRRSTRRLWVPITAAAAVMALVGAGFFLLRPRTVSQPAFTSDRETVTRVIGELRDRAVTAEPLAFRKGQVTWWTERTVQRERDGLIYVRTCENWYDVNTRFTAFELCDDGKPDPERLAEVRAREQAGRVTKGIPAGTGLRDLVGGPTDPAAIRAALVTDRKGNVLESDDLKVWKGLVLAFYTDVYTPADRVRGLFRTMAALPVSVGETTVDGRRLVVVRNREHQVSTDLLFDPGTGRYAGAQAVRAVPAGEKPSVEPAPGRTKASPYPTRSDGLVPGVGRRLAGNPLDAVVYSQELMLTQAVVDDIGDRP
ncbi:hypothetical protein Aab01nite_12280 [Paractinoplanes abujensis]|uniref:Uncharacterized protein n=1 Tax=Paractinoplanes abujensis TaxID=882441 RepID=A0A7W7CME1_9ACTN|nr:hypothetical protein [Actinoplanes abujensis]MBB4690949.1 hypothetical protein [Actinoplanes abujensis]GID17638.1 hypothetical protein Aab01nite_12280 [Actinoplanes abujensis]